MPKDNNNSNNSNNDALWLGAISGIIGGLFDGDGIIDAAMEEVDPEFFEEFFLDE